MVVFFFKNGENSYQKGRIVPQRKEGINISNTSLSAAFYLF